jgi:hypothetical protein
MTADDVAVRAAEGAALDAATEAMYLAEEAAQTAFKKVKKAKRSSSWWEAATAWEAAAKAAKAAAAATTKAAKAAKKAALLEVLSGMTEAERSALKEVPSEKESEKLLVRAFDRALKDAAG